LYTEPDIFVYFIIPARLCWLRRDHQMVVYLEILPGFAGCAVIIRRLARIEFTVFIQLYRNPVSLSYDISSIESWVNQLHQNYL
jgi:hypothetical protein